MAFRTSKLDKLGDLFAILHQKHKPTLFDFNQGILLQIILKGDIKNELQFYLKNQYLLLSDKNSSMFKIVNRLYNCFLPDHNMNKDIMAKINKRSRRNSDVDSYDFTSMKISSTILSSFSVEPTRPYVFLEIII